MSNAIHTPSITPTGAWDGKANHHNDIGLANGLIMMMNWMRLAWKTNPQFFDIGCGDGYLVYQVWKAGLGAHGVDGNPAYTDPKSHIRRLDLTVDWPVRAQANIVSLIEVWEHVPKEFEDVMVRNVVNSLDLCRSGPPAYQNQIPPVLIVSAAPPGQAGHGHVNCVTKQHVIGRISEATDGLLSVNHWLTGILSVSSTVSWTRKNLIAFSVK